MQMLWQFCTCMNTDSPLTNLKNIFKKTKINIQTSPLNEGEWSAHTIIELKIVFARKVLSMLLVLCTKAYFTTTQNIK